MLFMIFFLDYICPNITFSKQHIFNVTVKIYIFFFILCMFILILWILYAYVYWNQLTLTLQNILLASRKVQNLYSRAFGWSGDQNTFFSIFSEFDKTALLIDEFLYHQYHYEFSWKENPRCRLIITVSKLFSQLIWWSLNGYTNFF